MNPEKNFRGEFVRAGEEADTAIPEIFGRIWRGNAMENAMEIVPPSSELLDLDTIRRSLSLSTYKDLNQILIFPLFLTNILKLFAKVEQKSLKKCLVVWKTMIRSRSIRIWRN